MRTLPSLRCLTLAVVAFSFLAPSVMAVPATPSIVVEIRVMDGAVSIEWGNVGTIDSYIVERRTGRSRWSVAGTFPGHAGGILNMAVQRRTIYSYRVRAVNSSGTSAYSNIGRVRTSTRTVPTTDGSYASAWIVPTTSGELGAATNRTGINSGIWKEGSSGTLSLAGGSYGGISSVTAGNLLAVGPIAPIGLFPITITVGTNVNLVGLTLPDFSTLVNTYTQTQTLFVSSVQEALRFRVVGAPALTLGSTRVEFEIGNWTLDGIVGTTRLSLSPALYDAILANAAAASSTPELTFP